MPSLIQFLKVLELPWVSRFYSQFLSCLWVNTIVQRDFQNLGRIQITRQQISFLSESSHFYTSRTTAFTSIFQCLAFSHQFLDICIGIEDGRITMSLPYHLDTFYQEIVRSIFGNMYAQTWLQLMQFFLYFQYHIRNVIHRTLSFTVNTSDIDIGEVIVCS